MRRQAAEKAGTADSHTRRPTQLRAEADEEAPAILLTVAAPPGTPVRVVTGPVEKGLQRVAWDLRAPAHQLPPNRPRGELEELFGDPLVGPYVVPGKYSVTLSQRVGGVVTQLGGAGRVQRRHWIRKACTRRPTTRRAGSSQKKLQALRRDIAGALELANSTRHAARGDRQGARRDAGGAARAARSGAGAASSG